MNTDEILERVLEYTRIRPEAGDDSSAQVETALFIEEVFDLTLTDDDMTAERLGTYQAIEALVLDRLGVKA